MLGIVDSWGNEVVSYTYDAWGNLLGMSGSMANTLGKLNVLRYRGYVYDDETGLYYLNSRYYNPEWGRFINADSPAVPTISPGSATWDKNLFAYCDNNPVTRKDEGGNCWDIVIGAVVGGIIGGVTSIVNDSGMGREVSASSFICGAITGAISGAIGSLASEYRIVASGLSFAVTFVGSYASGASAGESLLAASTAAIATYTTLTLGKIACGTEIGVAKRAAEGIVGFVSSGSAEGLATTTRAVYRGYHPYSPQPQATISAYVPFSSNKYGGGGRWTSKLMAS